MTIYYTIQVSDHAEANTCFQTQAAAESWNTVFDGEMAGGAKQACHKVDELARAHLHARVFRGGKNGGRLHYAVYSNAPII